MFTDLKSLCIAPDKTVRDAVSKIDETERGIALVTDEQFHLLGVVTDGDVRRMILAGRSLEEPIHELLARKANSRFPKPIFAPSGSSRARLLRIMQGRSVRQLPVLKPDGRVVGLATMEELLPKEDLHLQAVIMAGGEGKRLMPLTENTPKPMLPVGGKPLMELMIDQLKHSGIRNVNVSTCYKKEVISSHFGNGKRHGVKLNYVTEDRPLGTAGALGLLDNPQEPLLVLNGDILTRIDFRSMHEHHLKHKADLTIAVRQYDLQMPYGVVDSDGPMVQRIREKPTVHCLVNAGIYLLEPSVLKHIPNGVRLDMTELIERLIQAGSRVINFPVVEYWLDIGRHIDYERAQEDTKNGKFAKKSFQNS